MDIVTIPAVHIHVVRDRELRDTRAASRIPVNPNGMIRNMARKLRRTGIRRAMVTNGTVSRTVPPSNRVRFPWARVTGHLARARRTQIIPAIPVAVETTVVLVPMRSTTVMTVTARMISVAPMAVTPMAVTPAPVTSMRVIPMPIVPITTAIAAIITAAIIMDAVTAASVVAATVVSHGTARRTVPLTAPRAVRSGLRTARRIGSWRLPAGGTAARFRTSINPLFLGV